MALDPKDFRGLDRQTKKGRAILALRDQHGAGSNPFSALGALLALSPGTLIPDASPPTTLVWAGSTVVYDDLGFFIGGVEFVIPVTDPVITRIRLWGDIVWPPALGPRTVTQIQNGAFSVPGTATNVLPETGSGVTGPTMDVISHPIACAPGDTFNIKCAQVSGIPLTLSLQCMGIEVVR